MDKRPAPGALAPNRHSVLESALGLFEADLNPNNPVHRQAAQLANLCVQAFQEYASLVLEAEKHLTEPAQKQIILTHRERALEGLSRLSEILASGVE